MSDYRADPTSPKKRSLSLTPKTRGNPNSTLGKYWLVTSGVLLVICVFSQQVPLILFTTLFFLTGLFSRLWERYCLSRVEYRRHIDESHVFFGEEVAWEVEIVNRKPLPLPWIHAVDQIPAEVELLDGNTTPTHDIRRRGLNGFFSLSWYQRVRRRYRVRCSQRGCYSIGPARLRSGDLFGVFTREKEIPEVDYLIVYPKILPLTSLGLPSRQLMGDIRTRRQIIQDPTLSVGVREYQSGDSRKHIHWKASARTHQLQTRIFESTTTVDIALFLDVRTLKHLFLGTVPEMLELSVVVAASIATEGLSSAYRVGLYTNSQTILPDGLVRVPPSQHKDQLLRVLEALAQVEPHETVPIDQLLVYESRKLNWGSTVTVISAAPTEELFSALFTISKTGRRVVLIKVGGEPLPASYDGISVHHVRGDVSWRDMESVAL